jgi:hypothetical protein
VSRPKATYLSMGTVSLEPSVRSSPSVWINPDSMCSGNPDSINPHPSHPIGRQALEELDPVTGLLAKEIEEEVKSLFVSKGALSILGKPVISEGLIQSALEELNREQKAYNITSAVTNGIRSKVNSIRNPGKPSSGVSPVQARIRSPKPQSPPTITKPSKPILAPKLKGMLALEGDQSYDRHRFTKGPIGLTTGARMNKKKRNRMK